MGDWSVVEEPAPKSEWSVVQEPAHDGAADAVAAHADLFGRRAAAKRGIGDRLSEGVVNIGRTLAGAGRFAGDVISDQADRVQQLFTRPGEVLSSLRQDPGGTLVPHPERGREVLRGVDKLVTLGYGQKLANAADPDFAAKAEADRKAAPGGQELGMLAGMATPGAANLIASKGAGLVKSATRGMAPASIPGAAALGMVRGLGGYEASAPLVAGLGADASGRRLEAAKEAATDPAGLLLAGGGGAVGGAAGRIAETAQERTARAAREGLTTGEQNARIGKVRKLEGAAGEDDKFLRDLFKRHPDLEKAAAVKGKNDPGAVAKAVDAKLETATDSLNDIYDKMVKADRQVTPSDIAVGFDKQIGEALKGGDQTALRILRTERAKFLSEYGNFGKLSPETLRGLKATAGQALESGLPAPAPVRVKIWKAYADAIETQARGTPGVDLKELRQLNKDSQILIAAKGALDERAAMQKANRPGIRELIAHPAGTIGAAAGGALMGNELGHHGVLGASLGLLGPPAAKAAGQLARWSDVGMARRFGGVAPDLASGVGSRAAELQYASKVVGGLDRGLSLEEATAEAGQ